MLHTSPGGDSGGENGTQNSSRGWRDSEPLLCRCWRHGSQQGGGFVFLHGSVVILTQVLRLIDCETVGLGSLFCRRFVHAFLGSFVCTSGCVYLTHVPLVEFIQQHVIRPFSMVEERFGSQS